MLPHRCDIRISPVAETEFWLTGGIARRTTSGSSPGGRSCSNSRLAKAARTQHNLKLDSFKENVACRRYSSSARKHIKSGLACCQGFGTIPALKPSVDDHADRCPDHHRSAHVRR